MDIKERVVTSNVKLLEDDIIEFIAVTEKYVPKDIIPKLAEWGEKQPIIYRHEHPAKGWGGEILGRSIEAKVVRYEDITALKGKAKMFNNSYMQNTALEYIREKQDAGEPIQISIGYQEFYKEGEIVDAQIYEYSLTHIPVCKECSVSIGELEMDENKIKELEAEVKNREGTINELQESLDEMSGKNKKLEKDMKAKDTKIKEYEAKYVDQKDKVSELSTKLAQLEEDIKFAKVEPKVQQLVKLYEDPDLFGYFKNKALEENGTEWLDKKLEEKKGKITPNPIVTTPLSKELEEGVKDQTQTKISLLENKKLIMADPTLSDNLKKVMIGMLKTGE